MTLFSLIVRFLFRKRSSLTWSGDRQLLFAVTMSPAVENTLSDALLVPGTQRYCFSRRANSGYSLSFDLHQVRGFSFSPAGFSTPYLLISSSALQLEFSVHFPVLLVSRLPQGETPRCWISWASWAKSLPAISSAPSSASFPWEKNKNRNKWINKQIANHLWTLLNYMIFLMIQ